MPATALLPEDVAPAFGVPRTAVPMPGGEGRTYRCGDLVLREENPGDEVEATYNAELFASIVEDGFRVPRPVRARDGGWLAAGRWSAWTFVEGRPSSRADAPALVRALEAFHRAIAAAPYPQQIDERTSPYARADRAAFGELPPDVHVPLRPSLERLYVLRRPVDGLREQVVHGDPSPGNVLIADVLPPAIIDMATYWRPPEFALAVAAFWLGPYRGDADVLAHFAHIPAFDQMLLRACIRSLLVMDGFGYVHELPSYRAAIDIVRARAG